LKWLVPVALALACAGCLGRSSNDCGGGIVCPTDKQCVAGGGCALPEQVKACNGLGEGTQCTFSGTLGKCAGGVCVGSLCGNGVVDTGELCDGSAGVAQGESCSPDCLRIYRCGDGILDPNEGCDCGDGSVPVPAGCSSANSDAPNASCRTTCVLPHCGDGVVDDQAGEECEAGALGGRTCVDFGFYATDGLACGPLCTFDTTGCTGYCGDRILNGGETCEGQAPPTLTCADFGFESGALGCTSACAPDVSDCRKPVWSQMSSGTTANLWSVWASGPADVFAVGDNGTIVHYDGAAWLPQASGTTEKLETVWGTGPADMFAVGGGSTILHWNGSAWSAMASGGTVGFHDVKGSSSSDVYVAGDGGTIIHWDGSAWSDNSPGFTSLAYSALWVDPSGGYVVATGAEWGANNTSSDFVAWDGSTWTELPPFPDNPAHPLCGKMAGDNADDLYVTDCAFYPTKLQHWDGVNFTDRAPVSNASLFGIWMNGSNDGYVVGAGGTFQAPISAVFHWDGFGWTPMYTGTTSTLLGVFGIGADLYAVGGSGTILHRDLTSWTSAQPTPLSAFANINSARKGSPVVLAANGAQIAEWDHGWKGIPGMEPYSLGYNLFAASRDASTGDIYAIAQTNTTTFDELHWSASTFNWSDIATYNYVVHDLCDGVVTQASQDHLWCTTTPTFQDCAVGVAGSTCHGQVPTTNNLNGIDGTSASELTAVGDAGTIVHWDGTSWSPRISPTTQNLTSVYVATPNDAYAVGDVGTLLHWDGLAWSSMASPTQVNLTAVAGTGPDDVLAGGLAGIALHLSRSCMPRELRCDDGQDDDCDGLFDCADPDCSSDSSCASGGLCAGYSSITCNTTVSATTDGAASRIARYGCDPWLEDGREMEFRLQPPAGQVTVRLSNLARDLDLVVVAEGAGGGCDPRACVAASSTAGTANESVTFTATAGRTYYLIVDGYGANSGAFTLQTSCP
jgi:hypothetical protein